MYARTYICTSVHLGSEISCFVSLEFKIGGPPEAMECMVRPSRISVASESCRSRGVSRRAEPLQRRSAGVTDRFFLLQVALKGIQKAIFIYLRITGRWILGSLPCLFARVGRHGRVQIRFTVCAHN